MAGFDFEFTYDAANADIVAVCVQASGSRARALGIRWRWRRLGPQRLYVVVDGNSRRLDLLGYRLERDLPLIAEGCSETRLPPSRRARIGRGFADMVLRGRHTDQEAPMALRGVSSTRYCYPPYEFDCPARPNVHARLVITQDVLVAWSFQEVAAETVLEELHTGCELVLEELVNRRAKKLSFLELVRAGAEAGWLDPPVDTSARTRVESAQLSPSELLLQLKDIRKNVRHRAARGAGEWLDVHWEKVAMVLEDLTYELRQQADVP